MPTDADLLALAIRTVNDAFLGLLTTVDPDGLPHARWMGASSVTGGLREVYTLTGSSTRKIAHLHANPNVCWVFSAPDYSTVVTLQGRAEVLTSPNVAQAVWDRLVECARTWCMSALSNQDNLEFITIKTHVDHIEIISPRLQIFAPKTLTLPNHTPTH
ncbi:MAG: pyridoxamine 5'-phosphate oxidase family protein [Phycisphaeraceae bacterium]|nr:pyridoxamine 5'-phosphate oxidase family protein [Phycisphaeraceae bacterium]